MFYIEELSRILNEPTRPSLLQSRMSQQRDVIGFNLDVGKKSYFSKYILLRRKNRNCFCSCGLTLLLKIVTSWEYIQRLG